MENEQKVYPRIWDRIGERRIVGETRVSWLVAEIHSRSRNECSWKAPIKIPKKNINHGCQPAWPKWFWSELEQGDFAYVQSNRHEISAAIARGKHDAATLRKVADLIGYETAK